MGKVVLRIDLRVVVDTDLEGADNIINNLNIDVTPDSENVEVEETEVENFYIEDAK